MVSIAQVGRSAQRSGPTVRHRMLELNVLVLNNVEVIYSDVILAVKGISLEVPDGNA